jgi:AbrB family looped-hinge helix DNA binding protein
VTKPTTVTSKGQITIPKSVRDALGIAEHDQVIVFVEGDRAILKPIRKRSLLDFRGALRSSVPFPGREAERAEFEASVATHVAGTGPEED